MAKLMFSSGNLANKYACRTAAMRCVAEIDPIWVGQIDRVTGQVDIQLGHTANAPLNRRYSPPAIRRGRRNSLEAIR